HLGKSEGSQLWPISCKTTRTTLFSSNVLSVRSMVPLGWFSPEKCSLVLPSLLNVIWVVPSGRFNNFVLLVACSRMPRALPTDSTSVGVQSCVPALGFPSSLAPLLKVTWASLGSRSLTGFVPFITRNRSVPFACDMPGRPPYSSSCPPVPPNRTSLPSPPYSLSFPLPPYRVSLPRPPSAVL